MDNLSQSSSSENLNNDDAVVQNKFVPVEDAPSTSSNCACGLENDQVMMEPEEEEEVAFEREDSLETVLPQEDVVGNAACALPEDTQSGLQKLLNKQKMELAFELRRLQYANRPVSNTDSKNRLEQFFTENIVTDTTSNNAAAPSRPRRDPTQFRSEAMRNEIEQLGSQQRVSNVLQVARQRLENVLQRRAVVTEPAPRVALALPTPPPISQTAVYTNGLQNSQNSIASVPSNASSNLIVHSSDGSANVLAPVTAWVPIAQQPQPANATNGPWLAALAAGTTIEQVRRDQIIEEISELVHHQLVTSALESEFRTRLEERVMQHLQNTGTDGNRTREYIRNIQQSEHVERNDFSHLGIQNNTTNAIADNLDSASTYQASQHQHQQRTASNTREIRALKTEISELKSMMKLSFELQLDMQRSLRQEISALIAGTFKDMPTTSTANNNQMRTAQSTLNSTRPANEGSCVICTDGAVDTVLYKCGHMCTCYSCSMTLKQTGNHCPVCRAPITDILRAYKCN